MSTRAIAPIVGTSQMQVPRDARQVKPDVSPEPADDGYPDLLPEPDEDEPAEPPKPITGMDGKEYTRPDGEHHHPQHWGQIELPPSSSNDAESWAADRGIGHSGPVEGPRHAQSSTYWGIQVLHLDAGRTNSPGRPERRGCPMSSLSHQNDLRIRAYGDIWEALVSRLVARDCRDHGILANLPKCDRL